MPITIVRFQSKNPVVAIGLVAVVLAMLIFFLSAALALAAGAALVGGVGIAASRLGGGRRHERVGSAVLDRLDPANEIHALPTAASDHDMRCTIVSTPPTSGSPEL